ncbi:MAG: glycosyltransferase [bacterium]|nr:glycosyltransferase [bacterium]
MEKWLDWMVEASGWMFLAIYGVCAVVLGVYAVNCYVMIWLFHRRRREEQERYMRECERFWSEATNADLPVVTTQLPVYNEANVVVRLLQSVVGVEYPREKHQIQVLDDSTDETTEVIAEEVRRYQAAGVWIEHIRRGTREGYKAGALQYGMERAVGEYIAIFDADFVPQRDFLRRLLPTIIVDERGAAVQARWEYLNREESVLTRAQSIGLDAHFAIEQGARAWNGLYMNFNGTAGIWRRAAIEAVGGWQDDTLTEDMDLSYRVQLAGWRMKFVFDVEVPCELPGTVSSYKTQQFRWAKGSLQTARKLLPAILRSRDGWFRKFEAVMHLTHHVIDPLIMILVVCALPALLMARGQVHGVILGVILCGLFVLSISAPAALHGYGQRVLGRRWWHVMPYIPVLSCLYTGLLVSNCKAMYETLRGIQSPFVRTPKEGEGASKRVKYRPVGDRYGWVELGLGVYCTISLGYCLLHGHVILAYFMLLNSVAFVYVGLHSLRVMGVGGATEFTVVGKRAPG